MLYTLPRPQLNDSLLILSGNKNYFLLLATKRLAEQRVYQIRYRVSNQKTNKYSMVEITEMDNHIKIEPKGFLKIFAFKSPFTVSKKKIIKVYQNPKELSGWIGWRLPGTSIPFLINAGTFYLKGKKNFWFVSKKANAIIIELKDEEFDKLIIEVENPESIIQQLQPK